MQSQKFMQKIISLFVFLFIIKLNFAQNKYTLSGYVRDSANGEALSGCNISVLNESSGAQSNAYGFYSLSLKPGSYTIIFSFVGYNSFSYKVSLDKNINLNVDLLKTVNEVGKINIKGKKKESIVEKVEMSSNNLSINQIKKIPALLGEVDIVRSIQLLPGVSTVGEGASGFNVRGGNIDQNLILLDEAPVFNSSHLFGFFSVFNPDAVKDVKLLKGGIPSVYGGRLSSVLDVRMKEGNNKKYEGSGGIGLIFSRFAIEGPIKKNKASFIVAGRRSYIDVLVKPFTKNNESLKDAIFYFYDLTGKVNYRINSKNKIFISSYIGRDVFGAATAKFDWGNTTLTSRWNYSFSRKGFLNTTFYYSNFSYGLGFKTDDAKFDWTSNIINYSLKPDLTYYINTRNTLNLGVLATYYTFKPGNAISEDNGNKTNFSLPDKYARELAVYADNEQKVNKKIILRYGIRYSYFDYIGKGTKYILDNPIVQNQPKIVKEKVQVGAGELIQNYGNFEPRFSANYIINQKQSIKLGYNRMAQYIHLISNTAASVPLDIWTPSTNNIKPQLADQIALGYFRNYGKDDDYETSAEVFYKDMQNQIDYIDGADLLLNTDLETQLLNGKGRAYGLELYVKKNSGNLTGWVSYTLSKSERKVTGINQDNWYANRFDRRHNFNFVVSHPINEKWSMSANFVFASGTPITLPSTKYSVAGINNIPQNPNDKRNNVRIPDYHRLDFSATREGKKFKHWEGEWVFSIYNAYARKNAFSIYATPNFKNNNTPTIVRYSVIGTVIPAVTYNFKFK